MEPTFKVWAKLMLMRRFFSQGGSGPAYTLQADGGLIEANRFAGDSGTPSAQATITWYQVGDASGRGGEIWQDLDNFGESKLGDWVLPNAESGDFYLQFSNLTGDTPSGWSTSWQQIGGAGSGNVSLTLGAATAGDDFNEAEFDVDLGTDASTSDDGPSNWTLQADAR